MAKTETTAQFSSFKEAYDTLRQTAEELRSQDEPDIDNLATKVVRSVEAYKECDKRISAVEKALEGVFARDYVKAAAGTALAAAPARGEEAGGSAPRGGKNEEPAGKGGKFDDFEEDIPF